MNYQTAGFVISILALTVAVGGYLMSRQASWSIRYFERWFQLARLVLDHPETFLPLWCSRSQYQQLYGSTLPVDREPDPKELVFAEIYVDFVLEVNRRRNWVAFLTGPFPAKVPLTNPRVQHLWVTYLRSMYSKDHQEIVDGVIARGY
jgi:hypothetical protein